jgi:hypothetical protein
MAVGGLGSAQIADGSGDISLETQTPTAGSVIEVTAEATANSSNRVTFLVTYNNSTSGTSGIQVTDQNGNTLPLQINDPRNTSTTASITGSNVNAGDELTMTFDLTTNGSVGTRTVNVSSAITHEETTVRNTTTYTTQASGEW